MEETIKVELTLEEYEMVTVGLSSLRNEIKETIELTKLHSIGSHGFYLDSFKRLNDGVKALEELSTKIHGLFRKMSKAKIEVYGSARYNNIKKVS